MTVDFLSHPTAVTVDMGPATLHLNGVAGDDLNARFRFLFATGMPVPLDGTWRCQIRLKASDPTELDAFTVDAVDQTTGIISVHLSSSQTTALPTRTVWDLENIGTAGTRTWFTGSLYIAKDVTR